ncbi:hypothetical protein [Nocardioides bizhenqiangii]|uniref:DUF4254 domain-containing protein n=1 Tax=Nocardioides bizhenqiangii TaxID=3095076 RepID=A0ABZ0ZP50_9ACTN|nr:hypothetical protein [Nocardioides sp. HM61]WQQ25845.1 hypothetical protein SHK19_17995 [Nocardioides sp. HM61]
MTDHSRTADAVAAVVDDLAGDGDIDITSWTDLDGLPRDIDVLAAQAHQIFQHARTWVCQREGFEPSPICLLSPLAELMDVFAQGFAEVERIAVADWQSIREAVVATTADLKAVDQMVADWLPVVA